MTAWRWWEELTTTDFAALDPATTAALLPVAAIEQHGAHLPLGTDAIITDAIVAAALDRLQPEGAVLRLPTQRIGLSPEHGRFTGTLTLTVETALDLWCEIGRGVAAAGVTKLILFNGHGGQVALVDLVAQRLRGEAGICVVRANYFHAPVATGLVPEAERWFGWHGGQVETSMMLAVAPELVRLERVEDFSSRAAAVASRHRVLAVEGETGLGWLAEDLNPLGVTGNAAQATAEIGRALLDHYARWLATLIREVQHLPWPLAGAGGDAIINQTPSR
jgi:Uncharacterized protein, putative amidase